MKDDKKRASSIVSSLLQRKRTIFITGDFKKESAYFINFILKEDFSIFFVKKIPGFFDFWKIIRSDVLIFEDDLTEDSEKIKNFLKPLQFCVFVITDAKKKARVNRLLYGFPKKWGLVMDFSVAKKIQRKTARRFLTFGINKKGADFYITDVRQKEEETNFKVNYNSNIIPFWIKGRLKIKEIYSILPALCLARLFNLNLAEVSYEIKEEFKVFTSK